MLRRFGFPLAVWLPLLAWWLAFLPGCMSSDSTDSWHQIVSGHWNNHHPAPFTAYMWVTSGAGTSPAGTSLANTLLMAAALVYLAGAIGRATGSNVAPKVVAVALTVLPLAGPFTVILWKDIPETALCLLLAGLVISATREAPANGNRWVCLAAATSLGIALLRWNGVATVLVVALAAALVLPAGLRWLGAPAIAVAGIAGIGILLLLPHVAPVKPLSRIDRNSQQLADLAQFLAHTPASLGARGTQSMEKVAPLAEWRQAGQNCFTIDSVLFDVLRSAAAQQAVNAEMNPLMSTWWHAARTAPGALLRARRCRAALAWSPVDPTNHRLLTVWTRISTNPDGLHWQGPAALRKAAIRYADNSRGRNVHTFGWRPMIWLLLAAGLAIAVWRSRWRLVVATLAVPLAVVASYAASPPAQDARYTYAAVLICQMFVAAALASVLTSLTRRSRTLLRRRREMTDG